MVTGTSIAGHDLAGVTIGLLRDLVHQMTGLYYPDGQTDAFARKLEPLARERGFASLLDYYYLLKYDAGGAAERARVIDALAVPETYFWREIDQLRAIVDVVVPGCVRALGSQPLRIWSVPCASGEEPLTIAMMLEEAGWFDRARLELCASDASPQAIARARRGLYRERSFRALPDALRERYFTRDADGWRVDPRLAGRVEWSVANLLGPEAAPLAGAPIVVCRNLFIYFSEQSIRRAVALLAERMPSPGYLCLGVSESLLRFDTDFQLEEVGGAFLYVKREPREA
jgi:chemotaxis protein methyltransferase CheR